MYALACDLTNEWPGEMHKNKSTLEIYTAAQLQMRLYEELWGE